MPEPVAKDPDRFTTPPSVWDNLSQPGGTLDTMLKTATEPVDPKLKSDLTGLKERQIGTFDALSGYHERIYQEDRDAMQRARASEGVAKTDIKPWNVEAEREKWATDPMRAFGSLGSVF